MTEFFLELLREGGYLGVFVLMMLENVFPPIPSEVILGAAGVLVARGQMTFVTLWLVATAGTLAGNLCWYWLGLRWNEEQLKRVIDRWGRWLTFEWDEFKKARNTFRKHGDWIVFVLRFSPVFRTIVSLPAGLARMNVWRFVIFTFLGSLIWNGVLIFGGRALAEWVIRYEKIAGPAVIVAVMIGVLYYVYRVVTWKPVKAHEAEDQA
jgi:membrane protein DedA with SNARE-associated domain